MSRLEAILEDEIEVKDAHIEELEAALRWTRKFLDDRNLLGEYDELQPEFSALVPSNSEGE